MKQATSSPVPLTPHRMACLMLLLLAILLGGCGDSDSEDSDQPEVESESLVEKTLQDEALDGDLDFTALTNFGRLQPGLYHLSGQASWAGCPAFPAIAVCVADLDGFVFSIPPDTVLDVKAYVMIEYDMPAAQANAITRMEMLWELNGVDHSWSTESLDTWVRLKTTNLAQIGGTNNFFQTPTWSLTYTGPHLADGESIIMYYRFVLKVRAPARPGP